MTDKTSHWNLKNALEFNKFTCTINIAMVAYSLNVVKNVNAVGGKIFFTAMFFILVLSFIYGISVFGRAAKISENIKDDKLLHYAKLHVFSLGVCCAVLCIYALLDSWGVLK